MRRGHWGRGIHPYPHLDTALAFSLPPPSTHDGERAKQNVLPLHLPHPLATVRAVQTLVVEATPVGCAALLPR